MLKDLHVDQARFIALLANTVQAQRDALLGNVAEKDLGGPMPGRGEHNPTAELAVEPLLADAPKPAAALSEAISALSEPAREVGSRSVSSRDARRKRDHRCDHRRSRSARSCYEGVYEAKLAA
jgi:hypothetical protein